MNLVRLGNYHNHDKSYIVSSPGILKTWAVLLCFFLSFSSHAQKEGITSDDAIEITTRIQRPPNLSRDSAIIEIKAAIQFFHSEEDTCWLIKALSKYSTLLAHNNAQEDALGEIQKADKLLKQSQCDTLLEAYLDIARIGNYRHMGDPQTASELAYECLRKYRGKPVDTVVLLGFMMATGYEGGDLDRAIKYQDTAFNYASASGLIVFQQRSLINAGTFYAWQEDFTEAKDYFIKALEFVKMEKSFSPLATLYNNIAGLSEDPEEVLMYIDSAIYYSEKADDLKGQEIYTMNKAIYFKMIDDYENAYFSIYKALILKDSVLSQEKILAVTEMEEKYEAERKNNEINDLKLQNLTAEAQFQKNRNRLLAGLFVLLSLAGFLATRYYITNKHKNILEQKNLELSIAHERSDQLLLNILPEEVADELKQKGQSDAKLYDIATIMFTDFIDFTKGVEKLSSEELLEELNFYFRSFDAIIEKYQVEKIKTIGDSYMAVGGLPSPFLDSVKNTVLAALEMQDVVEARNTLRSGKHLPSFEMRIGVHTGPIVAGIVGVKKFQYDVWGDAVNTASRLENTSEAGKVNISQTTYEHIKDLKKEGTTEPLFVFESRGKVQAKGKGEVNMFFVSLA